MYEDEFREIVPIQYGVNILEWNPGGEKSLNKNEGETGSAQKTYSYEADALIVLPMKRQIQSLSLLLNGSTNVLVKKLKK